MVSVGPVVLTAPGRGTDLQVRVSAPASGSQLPVIVFAHGFGGSLYSYTPLVQYWAARGFVVLQPTFLDSRLLALAPDDPRQPTIWHQRVLDMKNVLDNLDQLEAAVPGLQGRVDHGRIAAVGHSYGGQTAGMLLGARVLGADGKPGEDLSDARVQVGVLLSAAGQGGADLKPFAAELFPFMNPSFAEMTTPTLVVAGDHDQSPLSSRGPDWFTDAYTLAPATPGNCLLTVFGGEHLLGGISGFLVTETTDEDPARVAAVQEFTWAYLQSAFNPGDDSWAAAQASLASAPDPQGKMECK
ncbi:MAG: alpha/beta fold hydrolase [Hymenobacter sp.]